MADKLMSIAELADYLGMSKSTIYQRRYRGDSLPSSIKFGQGAVRYRESDVLAWLEEHADTRPAA